MSTWLGHTFVAGMHFIEECDKCKADLEKINQTPEPKKEPEAAAS